MYIDEIKFLNEIEIEKKSEKSVFEWIEFFNLDKTEAKDFIQMVDKLVNTYEIVIKNSYVYLGKWDDFYHGSVRVNKRGFGFIDFEDRESIYISKENLKNVYDRDTIVVQVISDKDEAVVVKVLERNLKILVGTLYTKRKPVKFIADNFLDGSKVVITNLNDFPNLHRHKVSLDVIKFEDNKIQCKINKVLGYMDDPGVDILAILVENGIRTEWPKPVIEELKGISDKVLDSDKENRIDLTKELIFTIDGDDAKDLDDAVSIRKNGNNFVLGVHIMDVDYYVNKGSEIDKEAFKRGTSVYVVDRVVSMLPPQLSNGICSLNPNEERLAMSVVMEINHNGNVVDYEIFESVIESKIRLSYEKVNEVYNGEKVSEYDLVKNELFMMRELASILQKKRDKLGAIDFDKDEVDLVLDKKGEVVDIVLKDRGEAERLIENFMVTTNETVSRMMAYSDWPSIYRVHEKPDPSKMRDFAGLASILGFRMKGNMDDIHPNQLQTILKESAESENHFVLANQLLRSMQKARYDHNNLGHFGLGSSEYGHFTSPIRRYPDLLLHRMLKKYLFDNDFEAFDRDEAYIAEAAQELSKREREAITAEREVNDMKIAEYMEGKVGEKYSGVITSVHNFGMFIQLDNLVEGLVKIDTLDGYYNLSPDGFSLISANNTYKIGQRVKIKVTGASKLARNVDFEIDNKGRKKRNENHRKK